MTFYDLKMIPQILKAIQEKGYTIPTPIQEQSIPLLLDGNDILGSAQTGTGKTAAFAVPILQRIYQEKTKDNHRRIKALVLTPTRELANQIGQSFSVYGKHTGIKHTVIFGGVSQKKQELSLKNGAEIVIATPGRLLDLLRQRIMRLDDIRYLVLDEADRMLDMGFITDVKEIIKDIPLSRQTMLFSATMPKEIVKLSEDILRNPIRVMITPVTATINAISQRLYHVEKKDKTKLFIHLFETLNIDSAIVFTRTKHGANQLEKELIHHGIKAQSIHGNKSQAQRERALSNFKKRKTDVLVATDVASRGLDITALSYVINFDLPEEDETYIHRIGRTGRAGLSGVAISFCAPHERKLLAAIERFIKTKIDVVSTHPFAKAIVMNQPNASKTKKKKYYGSNGLYAKTNGSKKAYKKSGSQSTNKPLHKDFYYRESI